ncbi:hypothetical protein K443DRAFT_492649 [Laccaria amethystina LaAM-08-1]|uniref:Uncharacterized protein n=1 Tax=Laccaria amethystina LaAM-08-1 TaxID=1095629 RepID=A0A0C9X3W9_9AGAR|nr:hypothetical protein K443DRAFT_492649 [Laccaria amethystina LaAM-08-1]
MSTYPNIASPFFPDGSCKGQPNFGGVGLSFVQALHRLDQHFGSINDMLLGNLDLTGRHLHRWNSLIASFHEFCFDYNRLLPTVSSRIGPQLCFEARGSMCT